jgi:ribosomal protein L32
LLSHTCQLWHTFTFNASFRVEYVVWVRTGIHKKPAAADEPTAKKKAKKDQEPEDPDKKKADQKKTDKKKTDQKRAGQQKAGKRKADEQKADQEPEQPHHLCKSIGENDQSALRDHNKMVWLAHQIKKDSCPPYFLQVFQQLEKAGKSKGSALVNECVVRDARGKWTIDCEKPMFKDRGITFDLPPIIECACLLHMHACIDM